MGAVDEAILFLTGAKLFSKLFGFARSAWLSRLVRKGLGKAGTTVLRKTGFYEALAEKLGANKFITKAGKYTWEANKKFLDDAITRCDKFVLSNSAYFRGTGTRFSDEIDYLLSQGYKVATDGMSLYK
jgi:hypothetical protein